MSVAFFEACANGNTRLLRELLERDPDLVRATDPKVPHAGVTGLHVASQHGHRDAVRTLLEYGANPNAREAGDNTYPLHWAAAHRHLEIVRALVDAGGDVHGFGDVHELDVIGWATFFHPPDHTPEGPPNLDVASFLVERGARHHIISAIAVGDLDLIRQVVRDNPEALARRMSRFEGGKTALHMAIDRKRYDILDLLIELGANLEAGDENGQSALAVAMLHGDREAAYRLRAAAARWPDAIEPSELKSSMAIMSDAIKKGVPMIYVPDVGKALDWYASIGFTELARYGEDDLANFGMVSFGNAELMLNMHGKSGDHDVSLWFYTDKVDELYELLKARQMGAVRAALEGQADDTGIQFEEEIADMFYGARQFGIRDLNGYILYFIQPVESIQSHERG